MLRSEFIDEVTDIYDLMRFCWDNGYDDWPDRWDVYSDEARNDCISNEIIDLARNEYWGDVRDYLDGLDSGWDYWRLVDGEWYCVDDSEFDYLKEHLLETLDDDGFFDTDDDEEDDYCDDGNPRFDEPVGADAMEEALEPGNFADALNGINAVPQYDMVVAQNLARLRAAENERIRVDEELSRIVEESNRLTAGNLSAVFQ